MSCQHDRVAKLCIDSPCGFYRMGLANATTNPGVPIMPMSRFVVVSYISHGVAAPANEQFYDTLEDAQLACAESEEYFGGMAFADEVQYDKINGRVVNVIRHPRQ